MAVPKGLLIAASGVLAWLFVGAIFYYAVGNCSKTAYFDADGNLGEKEYCPWTFAQAFYFSVQTGLSIGFGLLAESKDESMAYSIFHILAGSSVVGGALALFASLALIRGTHFMSDEEQKIAHHARSLHTKDVFVGLTLSEVHDMMCKYPHYANSIIRKLEKDPNVAHQKIQEFAETDEAKRRELATNILKEAKEKLPEFKDEKLSISEMETMHRNYASFGYRMKMKFVTHRNFVVTAFAFFAWIATGTIFSVVADENNFITGLYFAVSTLSTAGMVSVKTVESQAHVVFTALFALLGVPLYCTFLGMFANILVDRYNNKQVEKTLRSKLTTSEKEFLEHLSCQDHKQEVDLAEFVEFQILRLGLADRSLLKDIRKQFEDMDTDKSGTISKDKFLHKPPGTKNSL